METIQDFEAFCERNSKVEIRPIYRREYFEETTFQKCFNFSNKSKKEKIINEMNNAKNDDELTLIKAKFCRGRSMLMEFYEDGEVESD